MMRRAFTTLVMAMCLTAVPMAAMAAQPATPEMEVQAWPAAEPGQLLVIVSTSVPTATPLPATVQIPIIEGMTVVWAGEIAPQGSGEDIQVQPVTKEGTGGSYVEFQAGQYRNVQVELGGVPLGNQAGRTSATVDFVQTVPSALTAFSVRLPANATKAQITPSPTGEPARNTAGEALYTLPSAELAPGDKRTVALSYEIGGATQPATSGPSRNTIVGVLLAALALAVVVLVVALNRRSNSPVE